MPIGVGAGLIGSAAIGAASSLFGGGGDEGPSINDNLFSGAINKKNLLSGNKTLGLPGLDISTPNSSVNAGTGAVSIDPLAREKTLGGLSDFTANLGETRAGLLGNKGAFQQARVAPLIEQLAAGRGARERDLSRTGVRGTFRDRSLLDFDIAGDRAVADQRALAEQESLSAINAIDQLQFNATSGTATNIFNQELAALGFGQETINIINSLANNLAVGAGSIAQGSARTGALADQARTENITGLIGAGLTAYGQLPNAPSAANPGSGLGASTLGIV